MEIINFLASGAFGIISFIIGLSIIVIVHEYGHYYAGKLCKVKIDAFSVGFGPELFGFTDKFQTRWKFCAIPLGGYVKFFGDENAASVHDADAVSKLSEEEKKVAFPTQPLLNRVFIVIAGPLANFIFAFLVLFILYISVGKPDIPPIIDTVNEGSAAEEAGLLPGDLILNVDGYKINRFDDVRKLVLTSPDKPISMEIKRRDQTIELEITPKSEIITDSSGIEHKIGRIGVVARTGGDSVEFKPLSITESFVEAIVQPYFIIDRTLNFIKDIFVGKESAEHLGGIIGIADQIGKAANTGFLAFIDIVVLLSVTIGLFNLFPIPLLDGGHLLMYAIEAIRGGKPLPPKVQDKIFTVGFVMIIGLMLFATFNDINRYFIN